MLGQEALTLHVHPGMKRPCAPQYKKSNDVATQVPFLALKGSCNGTTSTLNTSLHEHYTTTFFSTTNTCNTEREKDRGSTQ